MTRELLSRYSKKKDIIKRRLSEFDKLKKTAGNKKIFSELCFCILTPQSKAVRCSKAIKKLERTGLLYKGSKGKIAKELKGYSRFHNNKAGYIVGARSHFTDHGRLNIKKHLSSADNLRLRESFVKHVKGIGYKEASHFLRNTGHGKNIAIIDRHILNNLKRYGALETIPKSISKANYLRIEEKMRLFSRRLGIPIEELDLLFWSNQTGFVFK